MEALPEIRFGPTRGVVRLITASQQINELAIRMSQFLTKETDLLRCLLVGPAGSGKSTICSALVAGYELAFPGHKLAVASGTLSEEQFHSLANDEMHLVVLDDCQGSAALKALSRRRGQRDLNWLITSTEPFPPQFTGDEGDSQLTLQLASMELSGDQSVVLALKSFEEVNSCSLTSQLNERVELLIKTGPWPRGGHSIRSFAEALGSSLVMEGRLVGGRIIDSLRDADVKAAILDALSLDYLPAQPNPAKPTIVVEGETDMKWLQLAAEHAEAITPGLGGELEVVPGGMGRSGGATTVVKRLVFAKYSNEPAVGLLDNDAPGRAAKKTAGEFGTDAVLIPKEFDRLGRASDFEVEIEDLVSLRILDEFLQEHALLAEERHEMNGLRRIKIRGEHKETLVNWAVEKCQFEDIERLAWLLCHLREKLGFRLASVNLEDWKQRLVLPS